jgi:hypothetical protein
LGSCGRGGFEGAAKWGAPVRKMKLVPLTDNFAPVSLEFVPIARPLRSVVQE